MPLVGPECEQLSIVVEAERGRAVCQEAAVFEPVHHGNREATDSAVHGDLCCHSNSDVVRALDDLEPSQDSCKVVSQHLKKYFSWKCVNSLVSNYFFKGYFQLNQIKNFVTVICLMLPCKLLQLYK